MVLGQQVDAPLREAPRTHSGKAVLPSQPAGEPGLLCPLAPPNISVIQTHFMHNPNIEILGFAYAR